nr:class I SAM-dependent methyltransferase [Pseudomonas sp. RIT-PI-S]
MLALGRWLAQQGYQFITPTPLTHQRNLDRHPGPAADLRDAFGWNRPFAAELLPAPLLEALQEAGVVVAETPGFWRSELRCSSLGNERLLHSGYPTDAADAVFFGPDTYRFARAIGQHLLQRPAAPARAVDIGCGSGAGALVIAKACPHAEVWGTDINPHALALTRVNAELAGAGNLRGQASDVLRDLPGAFDLIVANPPYMQDPKGRAYRDGGSGLGSGLSLRILSEALPRLAPGGTLLLYTGVAIVGGEDPFLTGARDVLEGFEGQWRYAEIDPDVFGEDLVLPGYASAERIAVVVLEATRA